MMLPRLLDGSVLPRSFVEHIPMLIPPTSTDRGVADGRDGTIAAEMNDRAFELEELPGVLDVTAFHGFFKSDTPDVGMHIICTTVSTHAIYRCL